MVYTQCNQMIKSLHQTGTYKAQKESLGCRQIFHAQSETNPRIAPTKPAVQHS